MKRYPVVLGATVAGLAGVLTYHSHGATSALPSKPVASAAATGTGGSTGGQQHASSTPPAGSSGTGTSGTGSSGNGSSGTGTSGTGSSGNGSSGNGSSGTGSSVRHAAGSLEQYGYGELRVRVTESGSRITKVTVTTLKVADQYSQTLARQVVPMLEREVVSAQSAHIQGISGATYTSEAYAMSVQAALDKLHP